MEKNLNQDGEKLWVDKQHLFIKFSLRDNYKHIEVCMYLYI